MGRTHPSTLAIRPQSPNPHNLSGCLPFAAPPRTGGPATPTSCEAALNQYSLR